MGQDKIVDFTGFLKDIISIRSLSGNEGAVALRVREEMKRLGYDEIFTCKGNVCAKRGSGPTIILYDAHMDVVEPGSGWEGDPFDPRIKDGFIIGRGACDDKGSLASIVFGGAKADVEGVTLYVLASVREEVAEGNGLKQFMEETGISPDFVVIAEPSSLRLAKGNRGRLGLRIDTFGKAAHASDPDSGENAIYRACPGIIRIKEYNKSLREDSVAVTKIETANRNINIIPEKCSIYCDYRSAPGRTLDEIVAAMEKLVPDSRVEVTTPYYKPWSMQDDNVLIRASKKCLLEVLNSREVIIWDFCTNGSFTAGEMGIPTVGFGPGNECEAHAAEEKIRLSDIESAIGFFSSLPACVVSEGK